MIKIVIVAQKNHLYGIDKMTGQQWQDEDNHYEVEYILRDAKNRQNIISDLQKSGADILITLDLEGFEQCTLTDNISYNLLNCKQIHLLLHRNLENERYLSRQLSISMFFYCLGEQYLGYLRERYPNIPYLKCLDRWDDAGILSAVTREVADICRLT